MSYLSLDKEMAYDSTDLVRAQEFSYAALHMQSNEMLLKYVDMLLVKQINA